MARLLAADVPLRRARSFQLVRRATLALSVVFIVVLPALHAAANRAMSGASRLDVATPPAVGAPWTVSILGIEILDPLAFLGLVAARAVNTHVVVSALPVLVLVALFGRYFCSWMCPYAVVVGVSNAARSVLARLGVPTLDLTLPRHLATVVLLVVIAATAVGGVQLAPLIYPPAVIARAAWKLAAFGAAGTGAVVIGVFFLFDTFVSRAGFCRSLCPGGAVFRAVSRPSPVGVTRDRATCTSCTLCDTVCNMGESPMTDAVDSGCDRCGRCVSSCPTGSLDLVTIARRP